MSATQATPRPDLLTTWANWQGAQSLSERTITERVATVTRCAQHAGVDPDVLTTEQVLAWMTSRPSWRPNTRATFYSHLRAWFGWLRRSGRRGDNPMDPISSPRRSRGLPRPVPDVHMPKLLAADLTASTRAMVLLAVYAGLRIHEIAKLRGEDIDLEAGTLFVRGKGRYEVTLPLHPRLAALAAEMPRRGWWFPATTPLGHVQPASVGRTISRRLSGLGIPGTAHSLRHWYGSALVAAGTDLRTAQVLLRHQGLDVTARYTAVVAERPREALERLDPHHPSKERNQ